jgi:hypothetical protein
MSLTQITPTAALDASNYPAQKWGISTTRGCDCRSGPSWTGAPLFLLFLQEIISDGIAYSAEIQEFQHCGRAKNSG